MRGGGPARETLVNSWKPVVGMAIVVGVIAFFELLTAHSLNSAMLAGVAMPLRYLCYTLMIIISIAFLNQDLTTYGPTLAAKRGAVALMAAWLVIVPLGMFVETFLGTLWFFGLFGVGICAAGYIYTSLGSPPANLIASIAVFIFALWLAIHGGGFLGQLEHVIGTTMSFAFTYCFVRQGLTFTEMAFLQPIRDWPGVVIVNKDTEEYRQKKDEFELAAAAYPGMYRFWLQMENLYRVDAGHNQRCKRTQNGRQLFHGTAKQGAHGILLDGFRLPENPGMFGKGIYFADCPLKSWGYTDGAMWVRNGLILMCWVELGRAKHEKAARNELTQAPHRTFREWFRGEERYTSVVGDDKEAGGALRLPEYIVYEPERIAIEYICEVKCVPAGTPESGGGGRGLTNSDV